MPWIAEGSAWTGPAAAVGEPFASATAAAVEPPAAAVVVAAAAAVVAAAAVAVAETVGVAAEQWLEAADMVAPVEQWERSCWPGKLVDSVVQ